MIQTPEGLWLPVMSASMDTLADGRIVRILYVDDDKYRCLHTDLRDGSEEWMKLNIGSAPFNGRKQTNGDDEE
jgi:hypothetical protein